MEIRIENFPKKVRLTPKRLINIVELVLKQEKIKEGELSFVFVNARKMRSLNKRYKGKDHVTDVLAFDQTPLAAKCSSNSLHGDIIICPGAAKKNARLFETSLEYELVLYVIHGILHLLGYDDHTARDVNRMRKKEKELIKMITQIKKR